MDASIYKCPNCDAELVFDPQTQQVNCLYCRSTFTMDYIKELYGDVTPPTEPVQSDNSDHGANLYHCSTCGADIIADADTTATFCYYCHNPVILAGRLTGDYKPSKIIGFQITREQAVNAFRTWCASKKFIPSDFKSDRQLEKMTGLYVPFWVTNCRVRSDYRAVGQKIRRWSSGSYRYTEISEYSVERCADVITNGIPADGSSKIEDLLMESIEPYDYRALKDFSMAYFSGFYADKYDVDKAGVFPRIRERAAEAAKGVVRESVGSYNQINVQNETYNVAKTDWQYIMLPVWFMTYQYKGRMYEFAINGQTGKLAGTPPLDTGKLLRFAAMIGAIIALVIFLGGQMFI